MTQLILHHYPNSPFAEKIRLILGYKELPWSSVLIPSMMPKPDVLALTGGYRKTPILQIGADIYCDTALIADVLEAIAPSPTLYPAGVAAAARTLAQWSDATLFWTAIPYTMQPAGAAVMFAGLTPEQMKAFGEERAAFRGSSPRMRGPEAKAALAIYLDRLEAMLGEQKFFYGAAPSIADFAVYHCLWFVSRGGPVAEIMQAHGQLAAWRERMKAIGHGEFDKLTSDDALQIAHQSQTCVLSSLEHDAHGFALGERVIVAATDYGCDPVEGQLHASTRDRISVRRTDPRAGTVVVHVPRLGFEMRRPK